MYRVLNNDGASRERRDQLTHPEYRKPELLATAPNQLWSWDITKLRGPAKWTYFYLYVILDVFSRYVVGWMVAPREGAELARKLIEETSEKQIILPDQLTIHADRGSSMRSKPVAFLLADLSITKTHKRAWAQRADLNSAAAQLRAAEEGLKAAHSEHLPTVNVNGYAGIEGVNPNAGVGVFSGTASMSIPIFQGGRIRADRDQAQAIIDQRRAEYQDQRGVVELDVRNAYTDFETAVEQVRVAESNRTLALLTLQQSQDRFAAGVATSVEVVQSQETLAAADRDYVNSLYSHNLSKISVARALGQAETSIPEFLKGHCDADGHRDRKTRYRKASRTGAAAATSRSREKEAQLADRGRRRPPPRDWRLRLVVGVAQVREHR
jgi:hypothetical protein